VQEVRLLLDRQLVGHGGSGNSGDAQRARRCKIVI
jgi:hypothetical protein